MESRLLLFSRVSLQRPIPAGSESIAENAVQFCAHLSRKFLALARKVFLIRADASFSHFERFRVTAIARLQDLCAEATARFQPLHVVEPGKLQRLFECRRDDGLLPKRIEHIPKRTLGVSPQIFVAN